MVSAFLEYMIHLYADISLFGIFFMNKVATSSNFCKSVTPKFSIVVLNQKNIILCDAVYIIHLHYPHSCACVLHILNTNISIEMYYHLYHLLFQLKTFIHNGISDITLFMWWKGFHLIPRHYLWGYQLYSHCWT